MKIRLLVFFFSAFQACFAQSERLDEGQMANVKKAIRFFKLKNIDSISTIVEFPLKRQYPIPSVKNAKELKKRFHKVFDEAFIAKIAASSPEDWYEVGWRGITINSGLLWMNCDDGKISAINHQSDFEKKQKKALIAKEKEGIHASLKLFESPVLRMQTKRYQIRIDQLTNGHYRYACWKKGAKELAKPDLIIENGKMEYDGSGGNHFFTFTNESYTYRLYIDLSMIDSMLEVERNGKKLLTEDGNLISSVD